eukprot:CAMPEP_0119332872 /NCGR_PEP_ID=MMETSP1333-20130426/83802_1 /TAXON_ID=418940 /ORGANISM="Scyphosphaera apsteinii, Strain RCC1455" /LENGTH=265 /DNA_ID=CAMNT_0007342785 /DNA_START=162 /DNA_END=959 /DNA_ORIENTATION=+
MSELMLPPCPICAQGQLNAEASYLYSERVAAPTDLLPFNSRRQKAEVLMLHALLQQPSLRAIVPAMLTPAVKPSDAEDICIVSSASLDIRLSTPARRWLLERLLSPGADTMPAATLWAQLRASEVEALERWPELALYEQQTVALEATVELLSNGPADEQLNVPSDLPAKLSKYRRLLFMCVTTIKSDENCASLEQASMQLRRSAGRVREYLDDELFDVAASAQLVEECTHAVSHVAHHAKQLADVIEGRSADSPLLPGRDRGTLG